MVAKIKLGNLPCDSYGLSDISPCIAADEETFYISKLCVSVSAIVRTLREC